MNRLALPFALGVLAVSGAAGSGPAQQAPSGHGAGAESKQHAEAAGSTDFWKLANFALLAAGAGYLIYKRGGPFFASRTAEIRRGLEDAAKLRAEAEQRAADMERRLAGLGAEIEVLRRQALQESSAESERIRRQSELDLRKVQAQAEQEIAAAAKAARQELRAYSAELAVDLAERKILGRLTAEVEAELVESMVNDLSRRPAGVS